MPDLDDFKKRIAQIREALNERLPAIAETLALAAKGMAERRMKAEGFGVLYSNNPVPAWFFHGKELNQRGTKFLEQRGVDPGTGIAGEAKKKRKKKGEPAEQYPTTATWKEFRAAQGLQTAFIDLSYSNKMWANMQPVKVENRGQIVVALLGATNREAQNKMNWNRERFGDFILKSLNEEDGRVLGEVAISELVAVLDQFKLS